MSQAVKQAQIVDGPLDPTVSVQKIAFFDEAGNPASIGGGESGPVKWVDIEGKPSTFPPTAGTPTQAQFDALEARVAALEAAE